MKSGQSEISRLEDLARLVRYYILVSTTAAGSGHPTSSLSAADLMTALFFEYFHFDFDKPENPFNDRLIFSKGHASPLYYSLFAAAGKISLKELLQMRTLKSPLEGHPTREFKYTESATGSLGQGLSVGVGEALALRALISNNPRVFVLLGDGEMAEGSVWEAINTASYYKLSNLVAILDVNRLGQSGETILGHNVGAYQKRVEAFGWNTIVVDGHNFEEILEAFNQIKNPSFAKASAGKATMIIAKTIKGKRVSFLQNKEGWHGKALDGVQLKQALIELGKVDTTLVGRVKLPAKFKIPAYAKATAGKQNYSKIVSNYKLGELVATREAYGEGLVKIGSRDETVVVLDGDTKNSTYSEKFLKKFPERFFEMFIAEGNMVSVASGLARRGFKPFASTFSAFFTRAFDQIRMTALSKIPIKLCGSHAGVSIGEDGASQMGLEDLAMMQTVTGSVVFYPSDAVSTLKIVELMSDYDKGIAYLRTTRGKTQVIYNNSEEFKIGGSKVHKIMKTLKHENKKHNIVIAAAGITLHEALSAQKELAGEGIETIVVDCYCIKPIDKETLRKLARSAFAVITVEDHWIHGGLGDAVLQALAEEKSAPVYKMAVTGIAHSGKPQELLKASGIDKEAIVSRVKEIVK